MIKFQNIQIHFKKVVLISFKKKDVNLVAKVSFLRLGRKLGIKQNLFYVVVNLLIIHFTLLVFDL